VLRKLKTPFTIPNNWSWVKLRTIMDVRDGTHDSPSYCAQGIPFVTSKNLTDTGIDYSSCKFISETDANKINERSKVDNGDIIFAMIGTIGKPVIVKKEFNFCIKNVALLKNINLALINNIWVKFFIDYFSATMKRITSSGLQPFVSLEFIRNTLIPIPPYSEQVRIVNKIEEVYSELSKIRISNQELIDLCTTLKYKILDLFFGDNCRYKSYYTEKALDDVARIVFGQAPNSAAVIEKQADNSIEFHQGKSLFGEYYLEKSNRWCTEPTKITNGNSIVMSVRAPVGDVNICNRIICIGRGLCSIEPYCSIDEKYLFYLLLSKKQYLESKSTGSTFAAVNSKTVKDMKVVVCEDNIQRLIVKKIEKAFSLLDKIVSQ